MAGQENIDGEKKREKLLQSVDDLISKKEGQRQSEGADVVMQQAGEIQEGVDKIIGMEGGADRGPSERNKEDKKGDLRGGGGGQIDPQDDQKAAKIRSGLAGRGLPKQTIMVKKVRTAIRLKIKEELKEAEVLKKNLAVGGAQEYNAKIAKIRGLQQLMSSLIHATFDRVKEVYLRFFTADGRRKASGEVE